MSTERFACDSLSEACDGSPRSHTPAGTIQSVNPTAHRPAPVQHRDTIYLRHGLNVTLHDRGVINSAGDDTSHSVPILASEIVDLIDALAHAAGELAVTAARHASARNTTGIVNPVPNHTPHG